MSDEYKSKILKRVAVVLQRQKDREGLTYDNISEKTELSSSTLIRVFNARDTSVSNLAAIIDAVGLSQREFWARVERRSLGTEHLMSQLAITHRRICDAGEFLEEAIFELESASEEE